MFHYGSWSSNGMLRAYESSTAIVSKPFQSVRIHADSFDEMPTPPPYGVQNPAQGGQNGMYGMYLGPLARLGGPPLALTMLAQQRRHAGRRLRPSIIIPLFGFSQSRYRRSWDRSKRIHGSRNDGRSTVSSRRVDQPLILGGVPPPLI